MKPSFHKTQKHLGLEQWNESRAQVLPTQSLLSKAADILNTDYAVQKLALVTKFNFLKIALGYYLLKL